MKTQNIVVGVTQANRLKSFIFDEIDSGIDLAYLSAEQLARDEAIAELGIDADSFDIDDLVEQKMENYEADGDRANVLIGDWTIDVNGKYVPDKTGPNGFAAQYSGFCGGTITVEWSKTTKLCNQTSPCFMMVSGGTCGDLDTPGDMRQAYSLPAEYFGGEE